MKISIFAYTNKGCETALRVAEALSCDGGIGPVAGTAASDAAGDTANIDLRCYTTEKHMAEGFSLIEKPGEEFYGRIFNESDALIFIGATGIAVREIAPHIKDKATDPAVISIDEKGEHIIPILSGHIGGANDLARKLAASLGGEAVITTATDINNKFSVDSWAVSQGLIIDDMEIAKEVSARILEKDICLCSDIEVHGEAPGVVVCACDYEDCGGDDERGAGSGDDGESCAEGGDLGVYVGWRAVNTFEKTLRLIPQVLHLGIGCRKGIAKDAIKTLVEKVLIENNINAKAIKGIGSIDIKKDEEGLLSFGEDMNLPIHFFSAEELKNVVGEFSRSEFVEGVTGVDNVCERAAMKAAQAAGAATTEDSGPQEDGRKPDARAYLVVKKTAESGVTVAVAAEYTEVNLG